jgi:hypothetical protein
LFREGADFLDALMVEGYEAHGLGRTRIERWLVILRFASVRRNLRSREFKTNRLEACST